MDGGGGGGGFFGSLFEGIGGYNTGKKAERKMNKWEGYAELGTIENMERARTLWDFYERQAMPLQKNLYDLYNQTYIPLQRTMASEAQAPAQQQPGFAQSMGEVSRGYTDAASNMRRLMAGRYPSGSGLEKGTQQSLALNYPRAKSDVWNQYNNQRWSKMNQIMGVGQNIPTMNVGGNLFGGAMQGTQGASSMAAQLESLFARIAAGGFEKAASGFGSATDEGVKMIASM